MPYSLVKTDPNYSSIFMNNLGSMYERGTGVAKDLAEARKWYEQAAELGNEDARANVERVKEKIKKKAGK